MGSILEGLEQTGPINRNTTEWVSEVKWICEIKRLSKTSAAFKIRPKKKIVVNLSMYGLDGIR